MVGLGDLPGGAFYSRAFGISADGSTVVGLGTTASGHEAFIWDAENGMREIHAVLTNFGLDLTGWRLYEATGVSGNGRVIVGRGLNASGSSEAWIAVLPGPEKVPALGAIEIWILAVGLGGLGCWRAGAGRRPRCS